MNTIEAVRHFELGNPLVVVVISALNSYICYPGDFQKGYLNPLGGITYFSRPSSDCTTTAGSVEPGVGRSVVTVPLESTIIDCSIISINRQLLHSISYDNVIGYINKAWQLGKV